MKQQFHARCGACSHQWRLKEPGGLPMPVEEAIQAMSSGICPACGNDGSLAPVRWRVVWRQPALEGAA